MCEGVAYLHAMRTLHRDLKSPNVLVGADGRAKLGDFGLSKTMGTIMSHVSAGGGGTAAWSAPERFTGAQIGFPSDVYSLGVVLWECLTRQQPWAGVDMVAIVGMVGWGGQRLQNPGDLAGDPLAAVIADCFPTEPAARPTAEQVRERVAAAWAAEEGGGQDALPAAALEAKVRALAAARGDGEGVLRGGQCRVLPIGEGCAAGSLEREIFQAVNGLFATSGLYYLQQGMRVARVDCVLNAAVEERFEAARAEFAAAGCGDEEFPLSSTAQAPMLSPASATRASSRRSRWWRWGSARCSTPATSATASTSAFRPTTPCTTRRPTAARPTSSSRARRRAWCTTCRCGRACRRSSRRRSASLVRRASTRTAHRRARSSCSSRTSSWCLCSC